MKLMNGKEGWRYDAGNQRFRYMRSVSWLGELRRW